MEPSFSSVSGYSVAVLLLQMVVLTSEHFTVSSSRSHQVVTVGGHAELSCHLSPPQSAEHMNIGWYRDHYSQLVQEYENGKELSGKSTQNYVNRTVFLKDALSEGKMTLRIYNISVFDGGQYHCFFKDGDTYEEASIDLKVAALGLDIQINVQVPNTKELMVECSSGGWFPQAQMDWRDNRGNIIPPASKIFSQDGAGLLYLKMSVLLKNNTHGPVTCCFHNPVTGQEKRASIVLADFLFTSEYRSILSCMNLWLMIYFIIMHVLLCYRWKHISSREVLQNKWSIPIETVNEYLTLLMQASIFPVYRKFWNRVSVLDDVSSLYNIWMCDMSVILCVLMVFFPILIFILLRTLKGFPQS